MEKEGGVDQGVMNGRDPAMGIRVTNDGGEWGRILAGAVQPVNEEEIFFFGFHGSAVRRYGRVVGTRN